MNQLISMFGMAALSDHEKTGAKAMAGRFSRTHMEYILEICMACTPQHYSDYSSCHAVRAGVKTAEMAYGNLW